MDPMQLHSGAELLIRTIKWGFFFNVLTLHPVFSDVCSDDRECTSNRIIEKVAQEGHSVKVPLNTSKTVSDLCVWNISTTRWVFVYDFTNAEKYSSSFKEHVFMYNGTFGVLNVSKTTHGSYRLQDNDGNCVALINISVTDTETSTLSSSSAPGVTYFSVTRNHRLHWVFLLLHSTVLPFILQLHWY